MEIEGQTGEGARQSVDERWVGGRGCSESEVDSQGAEAGALCIMTRYPRAESGLWEHTFCAEYDGTGESGRGGGADPNVDQPLENCLFEHADTEQVRGAACIRIHYIGQDSVEVVRQQ